MKRKRWKKFKSIKTKNISDFYKIISIDNGGIESNIGKAEVYKLYPSTILSNINEEKNQYIKAYIEFLNTIETNIRVIVKNNKISIDKYKEKLNLQKSKSKTNNKKRLIDEYIKELKNKIDSLEITVNEMYFIVEKGNNEKNFAQSIKILEELGIRIEKLTEKAQLEELLYRSINLIWK